MRLEVLNPVALKVEQRRAAASRLSKLEGERIGLYWNRKAGGDAALQRVDELLKAQYPGLKTKSYERKSMEEGNRYAIRDDLKRIAQECTGVVGSTAE